MGNEVAQEGHKEGKKRWDNVVKSQNYPSHLSEFRKEWATK
jgi:hypothetical protein